MASNLMAMTSNLIAMAFNLINSDDLQPNCNGLQPTSDGLQPAWVLLRKESWIHPLFEHQARVDQSASPPAIPRGAGFAAASGVAFAARGTATAADPAKVWTWDDFLENNPPVHSNLIGTMYKDVQRKLAYQRKLASYLGNFNGGWIQMSMGRSRLNQAVNTFEQSMPAANRCRNPRSISFPWSKAPTLAMFATAFCSGGLTFGDQVQSVTVKGSGYTTQFHRCIDGDHWGSLVSNYPEMRDSQASHIHASYCR